VAFLIASARVSSASGRLPTLAETESLVEGTGVPAVNGVNGLDTSREAAQVTEFMWVPRVQSPRMASPRP
jgi:hypothetical protein